SNRQLFNCHTNDLLYYSDGLSSASRRAMISLYWASVPKPSSPSAPGSPFGPGSHCGPCPPGLPCGPCSPSAPGSPFGPCSPGSPFAPVVPATSIRSCIYFSVITCPVTNRCFNSFLVAIRYPPIINELPMTASPISAEAPLGRSYICIEQKFRILNDREACCY